MGIVLNNVSFSIIDDISLEISEGKITYIIGESGSGKSILLSLINGNLPLEKGNIVNDKKCGILKENFEDSFFCNTVYQDMFFVFKKNGIRNCDKKIWKALKIVGLRESILNKSFFDVSKGEQKKIALAILLSLNPEVYLLDEPFRNLDYASKERMINLFKMMKFKYGKTIIIASSDTDMALREADEVVCLKNGKVIFKGNKFDLFTNMKLFEKSNLTLPKLVEFTNFVKDNKAIDIGYRDDISDLMKDIYRFVK